MTLRYLDNTCDLGGFHISSDGEDSELCYLSESGFTDDLSDKVLATLPVWGPGYEISFEFQLKSEGNTDYYGYQALFAVTHKGSGGPGDGQPGIYHNNGRMTIWFRLNGNNGGVNGAGDTLGLWYMPYQNWGDNAMDWNVEIKKWHHVSVSSIMENGKVNFSLGLKAPTAAQEVHIFCPSVRSFDFNLSISLNLYFYGSDLQAALPAIS